jgi:hypothetical protein
MGHHFDYTNSILDTVLGKFVLPKNTRNNYESFPGPNPVFRIPHSYAFTDVGRCRFLEFGSKPDIV